MKTEKELETQAKRFLFDNADHFVGETEIQVQLLAKHFLQIQKDLLESASEGFEGWWEDGKDIPEILGRASQKISAVTNMAKRCSLLSEFWAEEAWQAAKISSEKIIKNKSEYIFQLKKSHKEKDQKIAELETIIRADNIRVNWENGEYQEAVHYNWLDDENRRVENDNFNLKEKYDQAMSDIKYLLGTIDNLLPAVMDCEDEDETEEFEVNRKEIRNRHGISEE